MEKMGVQDLKAALLFACELGNVIDKMSSDGQPMFGKIGHLMMLTDEVMALPSVKFGEIGQQVADLDDAEKLELHEAIKAKFDIVDDKLEAVVEGGIGILIKLGALVSEGKALADQLKK
jgi:hypothetical protein